MEQLEAMEQQATSPGLPASPHLQQPGSDAAGAGAAQPVSLHQQAGSDAAAGAGDGAPTAGGPAAPVEGGAPAAEGPLAKRHRTLPNWMQAGHIPEPLQPLVVSPADIIYGPGPPGAAVKRGRYPQ
jgi:hypothetical protein